MSPKRSGTQQETSNRLNQSDGHSKKSSMQSVQHKGTGGEVKGSGDVVVSWKGSSFYMPQGLIVSDEAWVKGQSLTQAEEARRLK